MAPTEMFASTENIGVDKLFVSTKCWRQQHVAVEKMLASTKYLRRQNTCVDKILASTEISCRRKPRVGKNLGRTKCWRMRGSISLLFGSAESTAADFSQTSLMFLLRLPDGVDSSACSRQVFCCLWPPCFYGRSLPRSVPACTGLPCRKRRKYWRQQNIGARQDFTDFRQTIAVNIFARRRPIKNW